MGIGLPLSATPTEKLTVAGNISATGNIIVSGTVDGRDISSDGIRIDSVFTTVSANSATWSGAYSVTSSSSANWNSTYTTVTANSANWNSVYTLYRNAS